MSDARRRRRRGRLRSSGAAACALLAAAAGVALVAELHEPAAALGEAVAVPLRVRGRLPGGGAPPARLPVHRFAVFRLGSESDVEATLRSAAVRAELALHNTNSTAERRYPSGSFVTAAGPSIGRRRPAWQWGLHSGQRHWYRVFPRRDWFGDLGGGHVAALGRSRVRFTTSALSDSYYASVVSANPSRVELRDYFVKDPHLFALSCLSETDRATEAWDVDAWRAALTEDALLDAVTRAGTDDGIHQALGAAERLCTVAPVAAVLGAGDFVDAIAAMRARLLRLDPPPQWAAARAEHVTRLDEARELFRRSSPFVRRLRAGDLEAIRRATGGRPLWSKRRHSPRGFHRPVDADPTDETEAQRTLRVFGHNALGLLAAVIAAAAAMRGRRLWAVVSAVGLASLVGGLAVLVDPRVDAPAARGCALAVAALCSWPLRRRRSAVLFALAAAGSFGLPSTIALRHAATHSLAFLGAVALFPWGSGAGGPEAGPPRRPASPSTAALVAGAVLSFFPVARYFPWGAAAPWTTGGPASKPLVVPYQHPLLDEPPFVNVAALRGARAVIGPAVPFQTLTTWMACGVGAVTLIALAWAATARRGSAVGPGARVLVVWLAALHAAALWLAIVPSSNATRLAEFANVGSVAAAVLVGLASASAARARFPATENVRDSGRDSAAITT